MTERLHPGRGATTVVVALSSVMMTMDISIVNVALPAIRSDLGTTLTSAQWVVNAYVLAFAALLLTVGAISDRLGRRGIFLAGHTVFVLASAAATASTSDSLLVVARGVQGVGAAMVFGTCLALLADVFEGDGNARTRAIGAFMAAGAASAALGPLIGGALVDAWGWRWIFAINLPIGVLAIALTVFRVPAPQRPDRHLAPFDLATTVLTVVGLFALNYAILSGPDHGWSSGTVVATLVLAVVMLALTVARQVQRRPNAMIDIDLFRIPTFCAATYLGFAVRIFSFGMFPFLTLWLAGVHGLTPLQIGLVLLAVAVPMILSAPVSSKLAQFTPVSALMGLSMLLVAVGMGWGAVVLSGNPSWTVLVGPLVVTGVGAGLSMPHLMELALRMAPPERAGVATGIANTAFPLGTATGVAVYGAILHAQIDSALSASALSASAPLREAAYTADITALPPALATVASAAYVDGLRWVFVVSAIVAAVSAALCRLAIDVTRDAARATEDTRSAAR